MPSCTKWASKIKNPFSECYCSKFTSTQLLFACSPAFCFNIGKKLWRHVLFSSTCFWYCRKYPKNDNQICQLLSSACFQKHFSSSRADVFCRKGVLRNFTKFTRKHLCQSLFFNKVALLKTRLWHRCFPVNLVKFLRPPATSLKKRLWHRCIPVNFVRFLRATF